MKRIIVTGLMMLAVMVCMGAKRLVVDYGDVGNTRLVRYLTNISETGILVDCYWKHVDPNGKVIGVEEITHVNKSFTNYPTLQDLLTFVSVDFAKHYQGVQIKYAGVNDMKVTEVQDITGAVVQPVKIIEVPIEK